MKLLVLGGTRFVGRAIVETALAAGHDVTLFNRGSNRDIFPDVARIAGDRDSDDIAKIGEQEWDVVVDVSAYHPRQVRSAVRALREQRPHHVFISTVSVYADPVPHGSDESAMLIEVDESIPRSDPRAYGGLKVLCERAMRDATEHLTVLRPTVVIGPHDPTDRFTWWVQRVVRGGRISVPERVEQPVQLVDAEDLAAFAVLAAEQRVRGTFNVTAPTELLTLRDMIGVIAGAAGVSVELETASSADYPLYLGGEPEDDGVFMLSNEKARRAGLGLRPLADSTAAVLREMRP